MVENQYISVKEFAQRAGISVQAVYKGLNNRLNPYVKLVDNQRVIDIRALQDIYGIEIEQPIQPELSTNSIEDVTNDNDNDIVIDMLLKQIEILQKELDVKNEQLKEKDNQMAALNERLEESHRLLDQQQQLQAMEKKIQVLENKQEDVAEPSQEHQETKHWWEIWKGRLENRKI